MLGTAPLGRLPLATLPSTGSSGALSGSAAALTTSSGTLTGAGALSGSGASVTTSSAALTGAGAITGSGSSSTTSSGTLSGKGALTGSGASVTTSSGTLTGNGALTGSGASTTSASGTLTGNGALPGSAAAVSSASAALTGRGALLASAASVTVAAGTLTPASSGALTGSAAAVSAASGVLSNSGLTPGGLTPTTPPPAANPGAQPLLVGPQSAAITPAISAPRLQVLVNGVAIPALSAEVNSNNYYHADSFKFSVVTSDPRVINAGRGARFWGADTSGGSSSPVMVNIQVDAGASQQPNWVSLITGRVDNVDFDPVLNIVELDGRDNTALFIEARTFETYPNQTSSQVVTALAQAQGLTANVQATTTLIDRYYQTDHTKTALGNFARATTQWDLIVFLAEREGFNAWVSGNTLNFQPEAPPTQSPFMVTVDPNSNPWVSTNVETIKCKRSLNLARDIQVTVLTWNSRQKKSFKVTAKATGTKSASAGSSGTAAQSQTQNYVFTRPNLTHAQAQNWANQKLAQISQHERVVIVTMAGETNLTPRQGLQVQGTGTNWDIAYYISEISRTIDVEGFHETVQAKNSSPKNTSSVG
jgi:phage protein D